MNSITDHPLYKRHNIDSAMNSVWDFYKTRFLTLFTISLVMSLIIQYASSFIDVSELQEIKDPYLMLAKLSDYVIPFAVISLINILFTLFLQYYVIYRPVDQSVNILNACIKSLKYFFPFLIIMILLAFTGAFAIILGLFLLLVGALFAMLYIFTIYLFILPVLIIEDGSIGHTIMRSFSLSHRNFWTNVGWVAVFFVLLIVLSVVLSAIIMLPFTGSFLKAIISPDKATDLVELSKNPFYIGLSALAGAITLPLLPVFSCVLYFNAAAGEAETREAMPVKEENPPLRVEDLYAKPWADDHPDNPDNKKDKETDNL